MVLIPSKQLDIGGRYGDVASPNGNVRTSAGLDPTPYGKHARWSLLQNRFAGDGFHFPLMLLRQEIGACVPEVPLQEEEQQGRGWAAKGMIKRNSSAALQSPFFLLPGARHGIIPLPAVSA